MDTIDIYFKVIDLFPVMYFLCKDQRYKHNIC